MASDDLREELNCSICLNLYTEPISLKCGHFCWDCIVQALDTQELSGIYSCPDCREPYTERPPLEINRKLCNIVDRFRSAQEDKTEVFCTYCDPPVPASKTCLHCEASFCDKHLRNHSKAVHHPLIEPIASFEDRKCSVHQEILKYYCTQHSACICMSCWVAGDHRGHQVELLNEASEKKIRDVTEKLNSEKRENEIRIRNMENYRTFEKEKLDNIALNIAGLFRGIRKQLDDTEERVLTEISRQEKQLSHSVSDVIRQLEKQKDELSRKMNEIGDLHKIKDPLTILKKELTNEDILPMNGDIISDLRNAEHLHEALILQILHRGLIGITDNLMETKPKGQFLEMEKSDILLDIKTANNNIVISTDLKSASCGNKPETRPDGPKRFRSRQVLSTRSFSSGTHYWEVDVSNAKEWLLGVAGHSIERKIEGSESYIGYNEKSWCLTQRIHLQTRHKNLVKKIDSSSSLKTIGIYLDYCLGQLSFYQLCDPIRLLHTFTATFTEPLHAAFYVFPNSSIRIIK